MHRSASSSRFADDYYKHASSPGLRPISLEDDELPLYDQLSEVDKKERSNLKFAENAIHVIPFVLLLCAVTLWFFSNPEVAVGLKGDSVSARIEGLTIEGDIDNDSDGTQTGFLPTVDLVDLDRPKHAQDHHTSRRLPNTSK